MTQMSIFEVFLVIACVSSCVIWFYLLVFRHGFWLSNQVLSHHDDNAERRWPEVAVIIPARNEAEIIEEVALCHLQSCYPGSLNLIIVDDQSDDGTGDKVRALNHDRLHLVTGTSLPIGWSGKLWAMYNGLSAMRSIAPMAKYVLFTDADIIHAPDTLTNIMAKAMNENRAMVSVMAMLDARGFWGSLLVPAFIFFFQKLYPFRAVNDQNMSIAAAAGGCMLVEIQALDDIGGIESIKGALIDDCALAIALKGQQRKRKLGPFGKVRSLWLGFDKGVVSLRRNKDLRSIWMMVTRTAYTQLNFSVMLLIGATFGMALTYLVGPLAFFALPLHGSGLAFTFGSIAFMAMILAYLPTLLLYRKSAFWSLLLPLIALLYMMITIDSARRHWKGRGGAWKGRVYQSH